LKFSLSLFLCSSCSSSLSHSQINKSLKKEKERSGCQFIYTLKRNHRGRRHGRAINTRRPIIGPIIGVELVAVSNLGPYLIKEYCGNLGHLVHSVNGACNS